MVPKISLRAVTSADEAWIVATNDSVIPAVSPLSQALFAQFVEEAAIFQKALLEGVPVAFIVALGGGLEYPSRNYQWFEDRFDDVVYVDRIVVAEGARGLGLGRRLYEDLAARQLAEAIACEVNIDPPNPRSMAFHRRLGFVEVGQQTTPDSKRVSMLRWELAPRAHEQAQHVPEHEGDGGEELE